MFGFLGSDYDPFIWILKKSTIYAFEVILCADLKGNFIETSFMALNICCGLYMKTYFHVDQY